MFFFIILMVSSCNEQMHASEINLKCMNLKREMNEKSLKYM